MIVVFDTELSGHHLEYIHHLWMGIIKTCSKQHYTFVLPEREWHCFKHLREWPVADNINLRLLSDNELAIPHRRCSRLLFKRSRKECAILSKVVKQLGNVSHVVLINLAVFMPLLPFYLPYRIQIHGIVYTINLYADFRGMRRLKERFTLKLYSYCNKFQRVYLLNAPKAVTIYNAQYNTTHFKNLIDPIPEVDFDKLKNLRKELGIEKDSVVFLHFGAMQIRKGTILLLKAIERIKETSKRVFIFAGKVNPELRDEFYFYVEKLKKNEVKIIVKDEFVGFEDLKNLCYTTDCILAPYLDTGCSSGVIGYGAAFNKPVIGSNAGLLGELIKYNELGIAIPINEIALSEAIERFKPYQIKSQYKDINTVESFYKTILSVDC